MCGHDHVPPQYPRISERVNHPLIPSITDQRLDQFYSGNYATLALGQYMDKARYHGSPYVDITHWAAPGLTKPSFEEALEGLQGEEARQITKGFRFGPAWSNHWLKVVLRIPEPARGEEEVIFEFDPECEAMIWNEDGMPLHAITGGTNSMRDGRPGAQEDRRVEHIVNKQAVQKGTYTMIIEVSANAMFGVGMHNLRYQVPDDSKTFQLVSADIVIPNLAARGLWTDFRILAQVGRNEEMKVSSLPQRALHACNQIMSTFRRFEDDHPDAMTLRQDNLQKCRDIAWEVLGRLDEDGLKRTAVHKVRDGEKTYIWGIGHCHIDTAWLWRYTQTQQKVARSWSTQCDLMDRWPNHQFAASSAQQYAWLEELYPSAFDRVRSYVKKGRFHPVGGAWLEHDCMLPSGESLVRQYMYGQEYFKSRFGEYSRESWLPDTFGYAVQLPQILRLAGLNYFFTQKLSWNNINQFPYSTFNWVALDGSQVMAHMTPVDGYNAQCNFEELTKGMWNNRNRAVSDECLLLFGNGDGGGGPTPLMLEKLQRLSSLALENPEVPQIGMGSPVEFFDRLCKRTKGGETLPTWRGELYLELHRGIYTTQAKVKEGNRLMEGLLRDLEYFATLAQASDPSYRYPKEELDEMWKDTMLNQFHDVLPGTTISLVIDDVMDIYHRRSAQAKQLIEQTLKVLYPGTSMKDTPTIGDLAIDPLRLKGQHVIQTNNGFAIARTDDHGVGQVVAGHEGISFPSARIDGDSAELMNDHFKLTISEGRITSLIDEQLGRELILAGPGAESGGLIIYEDYPLRYDAWDAEVYHLDTYTSINFDEMSVENSPLRASLIATASFGKSRVKLTFSLDAVWTGSPQSFIRIEADIDWHESHKFLKFALPVDIHSAHATYGTQFGLVERPTHRNTTQDQAKFEVCGHMLGDLSEAGYGISLVSRTKYGYAVEGNVMRLSLLRSPKTPDPEADQGRHRFEFAIMPHHGRLVEGDTIKLATRFTNPLYFRSGSKSTENSLPQFKVTGTQSRGIILETIKMSEDGRGVVLRLYESFGGRARGTIVVQRLAAKSAQWVNILENPFEDKGSDAKFALKDGGIEVEVDMRCFEIKTLKLSL